ncbi:TlpA disulfide reductase family protein [Sphingobacterium sp. 2149]|uniref:TlpA family protein disulfide reductase n=1 Tax=Sphingobacterium sp. 2149 TaxID=2817763 RepID=UPI0028558B57|nr:TlpA disulfide reductase family protein [Sphingobacterium sp. 2149]MDR6734781.1 thiol-disulfide isomerase/thioredoxin [Sphingobacterium sp. 2149]
MRNIVMLMLGVTLSTSLSAQTTIGGKFSKILPNGVNVDRVFFSKPDDGGLMTVEEMLKSKTDQTFQAELKPADLNVIRYVGVFEEQYPVYLKPGEKLTVEAGDGKINYSGSVSKENQVFAAWYKLIAPLRNYGYTKKGYTLPPDRYVSLLDSLEKPVQDFVKNIRTGNDSFDKQVKYLLPYSYKFDVLMPLATGLSFKSKNEYPAQVTQLIDQEKFADANLWSLPMAYNYMTNLSFVKYILYNNKQGIAAEMLVPEIADNPLRANFVLAHAQRGTTQSLVKFLEGNSKYMMNDKQKKELALLLRRANLQVAGGSWIDFSYPDVNGKMHSLSENLGKVVLLDLWATWCAPCLAEVPALEKLEKEFQGKDVVFISLSLDTDKAKWQNMVKQKQLSGVQLFSNSEQRFMQDYEVTEIPRYIVFDKNGKTVNFNAPRPSDPKLKTLIESNL